MKFRIVSWAGIGILVAVFWAFYFFPTVPISMISANPIWTLARLTCPVAFAGFHFPISIYRAILANAATYALAGLIVEALGQRLHQKR
jgi:hypothetical protein